MAIQARIPPALAAVHNFICIHDPDEIHDFDNPTNSEDPNPGYGNLAMGPANQREVEEAAMKRDSIAQAMWIAYQEELASRMGDRME